MNVDFKLQRPWLRPLRDANERAELERLAHEDNHATIEPTHVFVKGSELVGYASIGAIPLVLPWFSTRKCKTRDSLYFINQMENFLANAMGPGGGLICVPFVQGSPFAPHIEDLGYVNCGPANITFKKVK